MKNDKLFYFKSNTQKTEVINYLMQVPDSQETVIFIIMMIRTFYY